ncbi:DUF6602 domain-containing protein [Paenibacillus sp. W2I17]|uniref:DUF6602 domain-containing protein n=1 Tax=Paenibacillus sp. W2I17 TaxID=3042311 RepID=UPI00278AAFED|nr:DUF6602 domain-containing protein [Paenibacillus sp. W2I17]MDQ0659927.1 hypothetical protein [Paenibacillus sp. W2I17]
MAKELSFEEKKEKMIANVTGNYTQVERSIVNQLYMKHDLHGTTVGSEREMIWSQLFEMIIPKKFVIEPSVFIIDSLGGVSKEVDFAILDETYTPYIFRYGKIKFVPIEAIAAVIECKSHSLDASSIGKWAKSITTLKTSGDSIARIAPAIAVGVDGVKTQKSTRPLRILCALEENCGNNIKQHFDFTLLASRPDEGDVRIDIECNADDTLFSWFKSLNFHEYEMDKELEEKTLDQLQSFSLENYKVHDQKGQNISLLTFNFQLNQLLMLINNPILFPHRAYVNLFDQKVKD